MIVASFGHSQDLTKLKELKPHKEFDNILVKPIGSTKDASTYVIWVKDTVKSHYHAEHTETIVMLGGKARFYLADSVFTIVEGDHFIIPPKAIHSVKVLSEEPAKVLSTQCPEFLGKDRIFVD